MAANLQKEQVQNEEEDEETEDSNNRNNYLLSFVERLLNAPMKKLGTTPLVDVSISIEEIRIITIYASASFASESALRRVTEQALPIHIVGDIHGQFHDLRLIFANNGHPSNTSYLFLGDYVDRGMQGLETILLLMALQCLYPMNVYLLRGNHEDFNTSLTYGFYDECMMKFGKNGEMVWMHMISAFNHMPFSALIIDKVLCTHGGISPNMKTLSDIENIVRPTFIPSYGLACDLVWADPETSSNPGFMLSARGISFSFDDTTIEQFCKTNGLDLIVRAHQITSDMIRGGHKFHANGRMVTIFSAPNYLNMGNDSCVLRIDKAKTIKMIICRPESAAKVNNKKSLPRGE